MTGGRDEAPSSSAKGARITYPLTTTGDDGVSVLDTSNPLAPTEKQHLVLKDTGPLFDAGGGSLAPTTIRACRKATCCTC